IAILHERQRTALRESQALLARSEERSEIMEVHVALDGQLVRAPPRLAAMLGRREDELTALRYQDIVSAGDVDADRVRYARLARGEVDAAGFEHRLVRRGGPPAWVSVRATLARDADGRPAHLVAHVQDITATKHAEAMLRAAQKGEELGLL